MSEPEIARRCHACGASIRDHAAFCPQCGKNLDAAAAESGSDSTTASTAVVTAPLESSPVPSEQPKTGDTVPPAPRQSPQPPPNSGLTQPKKASSQESDRTDKKSAGTHGAHLVAGARDKVQRATGVAKHVGGDVMQRGQKLREMSSVVLDEASYDPSLRFVLVAAVLFFLFLLIVLLNRFIV